MGKIIIRAALFICASFLGLFVYSVFFYDEADDLGSGYEFSSECDHITGPTGAIPPHILNYNYDKQFIIAKQRLTGLLPDRIYYDIMEYNYPSLVGDYYWIIDKREKIYYGPLQHQEFKLKCEEMNVQLSFDPKNEKEPML